MLVACYKNKASLKEAKGKRLRYEETSIFGAEYTPNGRFSVVGPAAYDRRWFAVVTMKDGLIKSVR